MSVDPIKLGYALLWNTLTADATLMALIHNVWQELAPPGSLTDYLLLVHQAGNDVNSSVATRLMSHALFQVKVVGPLTDAATIHAAYARADALLQPGGQPLRNAGGTLACYREQVFSLGEMVNGAQWLNHGGLYHIEA